MLEKYEVMNDGCKMRHGADAWKPHGDKSSEPTPGEARAFWLEREVVALKHSLEKMTHWNPFRSNEYWSTGFQPPPPGPSLTGFPDFATDLGRPDPDRAERISRLHPGDPQGHLLGNGSQDHHDRDRACALSMDLGAGFQQDRAGTASTVLGADRGHVRACASGTGHGAVFGQDRASMALGGDREGDRALHGAASLHPGHLQRSGGDLWPDGGGGVGVGMIPQSWENGGGGNMASPLQFGDWIHLCGPVMRDLSSVASRWWDLTVRQAQVHYAEWKQATPLQRVQLQPRMPDELQDQRHYGRTEQRGVHLLLKAVASDTQQMLVTDRHMTSTAILFRLYVRYQPGGPGEKSLILKELTQLAKAATMAELSSSLRSWRRHFGRAREVGATLPDGTLLLRALEPAVQQVAKEDSQAAFRLAQSRSALPVDELPEPTSIWDFSQCLLAEAETLVLMNSSAIPATTTTPLKLKVMEAGENG
eukprot:s2731_g11.t1